MDVSALRDFLESNRLMLEAWAQFVEKEVEAALRQTTVSLQFSAWRVKDVESAVGKVLVKNYTDPLGQMDDLAGVRFAVLLSPEIDTVCTIIEANKNWTFTNDRNVKLEVEKAPEKFGYQSSHYVVTAKHDLMLGNNLKAPAGTRCEIQVRTLMQHAYAELVHDSIYKAVGRVPAKATRFASSSMALIETADHLFCETMRLLGEENSSRNRIFMDLGKLYDATVGQPVDGVDEKLNYLVLENYRALVTDECIDEIRRLISRNAFIPDYIRARAATDPFWSQPIALLAYWLVQHDSLHAFDDWPLSSSHEALEQIYSDLGISLH